MYNLGSRVSFFKSIAKKSILGRNLSLLILKDKPENVMEHIRTISVSKIKEKGDKVIVTVSYRNQKYPLSGKIGDSLLDVIKNSSLDIPSYGACDGTLACSTCHIICNAEDFKRLDPATAEEKDMLDLAEGTEETSRLGCQTLLNKDTEGIEFKIPDVIVDIRG